MIVNDIHESYGARYSQTVSNKGLKLRNDNSYLCKHIIQWPQDS